MKIFLLIAATLFSLNTFCQKEDYLVKTNGDTLWGSIELKNRIFEIGDNSKTRINASDVKTIKSRKYNGNTVVPCTLQLYTDNIQMLEYGYIIHAHVDTIMVLEKILTTPKMDLYFGKDNFKSQYYFYKRPSDSLPVQLVVSYHLDGGLTNYENDPGGFRGADSKTYVTEERGYVNQLRLIMGGCEKITETWWELLAYRNYSLIQLIKKYNKCK